MYGDISFGNVISDVDMWSSVAPRSVRFGVRSRKQSNVGWSSDEWQKIYYLEILRASKGTLSRWSRLHLQSLAPTNPHWASVVGYGPFSLCVIHKKGQCPSINELMMMMRHGKVHIPYRVNCIVHRRINLLIHQFGPNNNHCARVFV
jgi:hypothetical protein